MLSEHQITFVNVPRRSFSAVAKFFVRAEQKVCPVFVANIHYQRFEGGKRSAQIHLFCHHAVVGPWFRNGMARAMEVNPKPCWAETLLTR